MNRIRFGAALLILLLIAGFYTAAFMDRIHLQQAQDLTRAAQLAQDRNWSGAENFTAAARRDWDRRRPLIAALSDHEPMDQIEGLFEELTVFIAQKDAAAFCSTCLYLASQLKALGKSHSLSLQNFF